MSNKEFDANGSLSCDGGYLYLRSSNYLGNSKDSLEMTTSGHFVDSSEESKARFKFTLTRMSPDDSSGVAKLDIIIADWAVISLHGSYDQHGDYNPDEPFEDCDGELKQSYGTTFNIHMYSSPQSHEGNSISKKSVELREFLVAIFGAV